MHIHLCNYELGIKDGILSKYARELEKHLKGKITVSNEPNPDADLNHHINYISYRHCPETLNSVMITHFTEDPEGKMNKVKEVMKVADFGVCFSKDIMEKLTKAGVPNLSYLNSATDIKRRPRLISILTELYPDGRKREWMFEALVKSINKKKFVFSIIGNGWKPMLERLIKQGLQAQWNPIYDQELGQSILSTSDFLLYMGNEDAQSQSVIDAIGAGTRVIAPWRDCYEGLHIDHQFETQKELNAIFKELEHNPVEDWTFENYAKGLQKIWSSTVTTTKKTSSPSLKKKASKR